MSWTVQATRGGHYITGYTKWAGGPVAASKWDVDLSKALTMTRVEARRLVEDLGKGMDVRAVRLRCRLCVDDWRHVGPHAWELDLVDETR